MNSGPLYSKYSGIALTLANRRNPSLVFPLGMRAGIDGCFFGLSLPFPISLVNILHNLV